MVRLIPLLLTGFVFAWLVGQPVAGVAATPRELQYSGTLSQLSRQGAATPVKQFDLYVLLRGEGDARRCFLMVTERGGEGWAWPERFSEVAFDAGNRRTDGRPAHVLHTHDSTKYPVELPATILDGTQKLTPGTTWVSGKFSFEVRGEKTVGERKCVVVDGTDNFGRRQSFVVDTAERLLITAERRIFMGRGDEFLLKMELTSDRAVSPAALEKLEAVATRLRSLQVALAREEGETRPELTPAQVETVQAALPDLARTSEDTAFKNLVVAVSRDAQTQSQRAGDVASLAKKFVGQPAPEFTLSTLKSETIDSKSLAGKITVLHFWEYQGEPLEEPYGQVGYLDFIFNRRGRAGVSVVGIAVNSEFGNPARSDAAARSTRKLRDFMNLSYPIARDAGATLEKFGDPRPLGAKLPLWVVIGPDGKIAHYHAGFYTINPDEGLRELDNALVRLIRESQKQ